MHRLAARARRASACRLHEEKRTGVSWWHCDGAGTPRKTEVTYLTDAQRLYDFAKSVGINTLSIWAIQRDNGGCPGTTDSNSCSGIAQNPWDFSHILEPFTASR